MTGLKCQYYVFLIILLLLSCQKSKNQSIETHNATQVVETKNNKQVSIVLDVDKLIGLNIEQIKNTIGNPSSEFNPISEQKKLMPDIVSTAEWYLDEIGLSIDFSNNEKIKYIFVMNDGVKYSANDLMKMANLKSNSNRYSVKPQKVLNGSGVTGIHVYGK